MFGAKLVCNDMNRYVEVFSNFLCSKMSLHMQYTIYGSKANFNIHFFNGYLFIELFRCIFVGQNANEVLEPMLENSIFEIILKHLIL